LHKEENVCIEKIRSNLTTHLMEISLLSQQGTPDFADS
jgi:hypothetical protein